MQQPTTQPTAAPAPVRHKYVLQWHITHRCNLHCKHCYQDDFSCQMSWEELIAVLDKFERFINARNLDGQINLTGGEPLVSEHFFPLAEEIRRRNIRLAVLTNGTLIDENVAARLALLRPEFVQISLDGDPRVHDSIRGEDAAARTLKGIDWLKAYGVCVHVSFTIQQRNLFQLDNVARICALHHVDKIWWDRVIIPKEEDTDKQSLSPLQFRFAAWKAGKLAKKTLRADGSSLVSCVRGLQFLYCKNARPYTCAAGKNLLVMKSDGELMPCRRLPYSIGNIKDGEIEDILSASELMKALREEGIPEACATCKHAQVCRGGSKCVTCAKTGDWHGKDPDCPLK